MKNQTQKILLTAMFCALAFAVTAIGRIPVVLFLKYDPKDVILTLSGFIISPVTAMSVSIVSSIIEMFSISDTGIIGCIMNILSSCSFACKMILTIHTPFATVPIIAITISKNKRVINSVLYGMITPVNAVIPSI